MNGSGYQHRSTRVRFRLENPARGGSQIVHHRVGAELRRGCAPRRRRTRCAPGCRARRPRAPAPRRASGRRRRTSAPDRGRDSRDRPVDKPRARLAAIAALARTARPCRPDGADNSNTRRCARRPPRGIAAMCRCTSSTNASVKNPRATPDWLVTTTTARPARLSARMASTVHGKNVDALGAIEIADVFDHRAVAVEKDGAPARASVVGCVTASAASREHAGRRCRACTRDRAGTRAACRAGTRPGGHTVTRRWSWSVLGARGLAAVARGSGQAFVGRAEHRGHARRRARRPGASRRSRWSRARGSARARRRASAGRCARRGRSTWRGPPAAPRPPRRPVARSRGAPTMHCRDTVVRERRGELRERVRRPALRRRTRRPARARPAACVRPSPPCQQRARPPRAAPAARCAAPPGRWETRARARAAGSTSI